MSTAALSLSQYELERLDNIRRNESVLASLGLSQTGPSLKGISNPRSSVNNKKRPAQAQPEPSRRSSRIAAIPAPAVYVEVETNSGRVTLGGSDAKKVAKSAKSATSTEAGIKVVAEDDDPAPDSEDALFAGELTVYTLLREEKNVIAREMDTAAYHVAQNRALMSMVRMLPQTPAELVECWGWGAAKTSAHGERLLAVLIPHIPMLRVEREARAQAAGAGDSGDGSDDDEKEALASRRERMAAAAEERAAQARRPLAGDGDVLTSTMAEAAWLSEMPRSEDDLFAHEKAAFATLLEWKRARARELGYNDPCIICHNQTLCELVRTLPSTRAELLACWGIGPKRVAQHGELMLEALDPFRDALLAARPKEPRSGAVGKNAFSGPLDTPSPRLPTTDSKTHRRAEAAVATPSISSACAAAHSGAALAGATAPQPPLSSSWREDAGEPLASEHWKAQRDVLNLPSCEWEGRRGRCARVNGCDACGRYVAGGQHFSYAPMSQRMIDMLCSESAYGSALEAHASGWRWNAQPNHGQSSHAHQWWPPQKVVGDLLPPKTKLPLGTYKAISLLDELFREGEESEGELID
jgi:ribonuclease D